MQRIDELDLPYLPMEEPSFAADPWPALEAARQQHPWLARCAFGYAIHQFGAIKDLLWQDDNLGGGGQGVVDAMGARGTQWGRFQEENLMAQRGGAHKRIRSIVAPAFTPRQAKRHRPLMRSVILELLDEWGPKGSFDFEEFASNFPIAVLCSLLGAPRSDIPALRSSLETFGLSFSMDKNRLPALEEATRVLDAYAHKVVADRRAAGKPEGEEDLLQVLLRPVDRGELSERELYDLIIFLLVGGYDTSKNALTLLMSVLVDRPDIYQRCAEDPAYCHRVVEENFRYLTTSTIPRTVLNDIVYKDVLLPAGTALFFPVSVAGRDPTAIADPELFDPSRPQFKKHLTFGLGAHICLGQFIARAQIEEGLHEIARRLKNPRRIGPSSWRPFFGVWGLKGFPIAFDPAEAPEREPELA